MLMGGEARVPALGKAYTLRDSLTLSSAVARSRDLSQGRELALANPVLLRACLRTPVPPFFQCWFAIVLLNLIFQYPMRVTIETDTSLNLLYYYKRAITVRKTAVIKKCDARFPENTSEQGATRSA